MFWIQASGDHDAVSLNSDFPFLVPDYVAAAFNDVRKMTFERFALTRIHVWHFGSAVTMEIEPLLSRSTVACLSRSTRGTVREFRHGTE